MSSGSYSFTTAPRVGAASACRRSSANTDAARRVRCRESTTSRSMSRCSRSWQYGCSGTRSSWGSNARHAPSTNRTPRVVEVVQLEVVACVAARPQPRTASGRRETLLLAEPAVAAREPRGRAEELGPVGVAAARLAAIAHSRSPPRFARLAGVRARAVLRRRTRPAAPARSRACRSGCRARRAARPSQRGRGARRAGCGRRAGRRSAASVGSRRPTSAADVRVARSWSARPRGSTTSVACGGSRRVPRRASTSRRWSTCDAPPRSTFAVAAAQIVSASARDHEVSACERACRTTKVQMPRPPPSAMMRGRLPQRNMFAISSRMSPSGCARREPGDASARVRATSTMSSSSAPRNPPIADAPDAEPIR